VSGERVVRRRLAAILAADVAGYSRLMGPLQRGAREVFFAAINGGA
jgi:hypothetical protein